MNLAIRAMMLLVLLFFFAPLSLQSAEVDRQDLRPQLEAHIPDKNLVSWLLSPEAKCDLQILQASIHEAEKGNATRLYAVCDDVLGGEDAPDSARMAFDSFIRKKAETGKSDALAGLLFWTTTQNKLVVETLNREYARLHAKTVKQLKEDKDSIYAYEEGAALQKANTLLETNSIVIKLRASVQNSEKDVMSALMKATRAHNPMAVKLFIESVWNTGRAKISAWGFEDEVCAILKDEPFQNDVKAVLFRGSCLVDASETSRVKEGVDLLERVIELGDEGHVAAGLLADVYQYNRKIPQNLRRARYLKRTMDADSFRLVGEKAPDFDLSRVDAGNPGEKPSDFLGNVIVLVFYIDRKSDEHGQYTREGVTRLKTAYANQKVKIFPCNIEKIYSKEGVDKWEEFLNLYGLKEYPATVIADKTGKVLWIFIGFWEKGEDNLDRENAISRIIDQGLAN